MYHYITLGEIKVYMTGIGIIVFLVTFLLSVWHYCQRYHLSFSAFFRTIPQSLIITYLLGTYCRYLIESFIVFPTDPQQWLLYLTPHNYRFHYIGILAGFLISGHRFLRQIKHPAQRVKRLEIFFHSLMRACIPLGVFLVLGDNFIGKQTETAIFVSAIRNDSAVAVYDKVIPLGLRISVLGLAGHFLAKFLEVWAPKKRLMPWVYLAFASVLVALSIILMWQQYPRHLVMQIAGISIDLKQYATWIVAGYMVYRWKCIRRQKDLLPGSDEQPSEEV